MVMAYATSTLANAVATWATVERLVPPTYAQKDAMDRVMDIAIRPLADAVVIEPGKERTVHCLNVASMAQCCRMEAVTVTRAGTLQYMVEYVTALEICANLKSDVLVTRDQFMTLATITQAVAVPLVRVCAM